MFGFVVATRAALGVGLGLLVADKVPAHRRRAAGMALVAFGAATTVPAARWVFGSLRRSKAAAGVESDSRLIGASRYPRKGDDLY
jgi:hypothetical protein